MKKTLTYLKRNWGLLLLSIVLMLTGILLLLYPGQSMKTLCYITAATTELIGIGLAIVGLSQENKGGKYFVLLFAGAMAFVAGVALFFVPDKIFLLYTALVGLLLVLNGGFSLESVVLSRRYRTPVWWVKLPLTILVILGGFLCIRMQNVQTGTLAFLLGISLFLSGLLNLLSFFTPWMHPRILGSDASTKNTPEN